MSRDDARILLTYAASDPFYRLTLGGSSAYGDLKRGTVMSRAQANQHVLKLWPPGQEPDVEMWSGKKGHRGLHPRRFYCWSELRREWLDDYCMVLAIEKEESEHWMCRQ